jgi:hypothetical protein
MNTRNGLSAMTAGFLFMSLSGGVVAQTPQTFPVNPLGAPSSIQGGRAALNAALQQLQSQKAAAATRNAAVSDASSTALESPAQHFTSFDVPGAAATKAQAINVAGAITGYYTDANGGARGFLRSPTGKISTFAVPGGGDGPYQGTFAYAINDLGAITGYSCSATFICRGFVRDCDGKLTTFDAPGDDGGVGGTYAYGINAAGIITGVYDDANYEDHGFVRDPWGAITEFDAPDVGANGLGTNPVAINWVGTVLGWYQDVNNTIWGFLRDPFGTVTKFGPVFLEAGFSGQAFGFGINAWGATTGSEFPGQVIEGYIRSPNGTLTLFNAVPNPTTPCCTYTWGVAINDSGTVVGFDNDYRNVYNGYLRTSDGTITSLNFPATAAGPSNASFPQSINDFGWTTGWYQDAAWVTHSFLWTP